MGTPEFAVESLRKLVENKYNVVAVVTMPDKAVGRHHDTLQASPVKQYAVGQGIPVLQPERLKDEAFLEELRSYRADLQVVVAFRMLPEVVWAMPPMGTFNLHAALLPQYRGAAPINWAVINGETETGVTTFFLDHDIDTGRIIHRVPSPIADTDTVGDVYDRLMYLGADLVLRTVRDIEEGNVETVAQEELISNGILNNESQAESDSSSSVHQGSIDSATVAVLRPAPKLSRENTEIRWSQHTVKSAYDFIRGLSPYPGAWTTLRTADGKETQLKVFFAEKSLNGLTPDPSPRGEGSGYPSSAKDETSSQIDLTSLSSTNDAASSQIDLTPLSSANDAASSQIDLTSLSSANDAAFSQIDLAPLSSAKDAASSQIDLTPLSSPNDAASSQIDLTSLSSPNDAASSQIHLTPLSLRRGVGGEAALIVPLSLRRGVGGEAALLVPLSDGFLRLTDIQLAGKRRMPASDFLRGAHLEGATLVET